MEQDSNKELILSAAEKLFADKGYDAVGVQEIVTAAGITKPTLYYYYGSKLGLLNALIETKARALTQEVSKAAEYNNDFFKSLSQILTSFIIFAKENPDFFRLHCTLMSAPRSSETYGVYKDIGRELSETIMKLFVKATGIFGNMKGKEELYSTLFLNNVMSVAMQSSQGLLKTDGQTIYTIIHSFVYGFAD